MVSEADKEAIRKEARTILERFGKTLEKLPSVKLAKSEGNGVREELHGEVCDEDFRERMFDNAPNKQGDCIVAEKGAWT